MRGRELRTQGGGDGVRQVVVAELGELRVRAEVVLGPRVPAGHGRGQEGLRGPGAPRRGGREQVWNGGGVRGARGEGGRKPGRTGAGCGGAPVKGTL